MLSAKDNLLETIHGGKPDRFVNQFEPFKMIRRHPYAASNHNPARGESHVVNAWGVTRSWPAEMPGAFPEHDEAHIVCKDISHWRDYVKAPNILFPAEEWAKYQSQWDSIDRDQYFVTASIAPGIFEQCHYLMEIQNFLMAFYEYPDELHELIDYLADWELRYAEQLCKYIRPTALFHHDDWGSQQSTFISPEMFREFILPAYKKVYGYYKAHGVEVIVHHSDSFAATLVPDMIEMGIDIWQGAMSTNNLPQLISQYGGKLSIMGGIDSASVDHADWSREEIAAAVQKACTQCGKLYFIPNTTMGGPMSSYPGVYETVSEEIDKYSKQNF